MEKGSRQDKHLERHRSEKAVTAAEAKPDWEATHSADASGTTLRPFIRWAGGKRWLAFRYPGLILVPEKGTYFEPFVGSAAMFASVRPGQAVLSDLNRELITTYHALRDYPGEVEALLEQHQRNHNQTHYYNVRSEMPASIPDAAARFLYLNRTCFNGIYRVNRDGRFNVPMGSRESILRSDDDFGAWSSALRTCELVTEDFEAMARTASRGDVIYADPPYTVRHNMNSFRKYNESLFSWEDQERLARTLTEAALRGVRVIVSNADHVTVSGLYPKLFSRRSIARNSSIAASPEKRGAYDELLLWTEGAINERILS